MLLLLEELDAWENAGSWSGGKQLIRKSDGDGEGGWTEADAEEVKWDGVIWTWGEGVGDGEGVGCLSDGRWR